MKIYTALAVASILAMHAEVTSAAMPTQFCATHFEKLENLPTQSQERILIYTLFINQGESRKYIKEMATKKDHQGLRSEMDSYNIATSGICNQISNAPKAKLLACSIKKINDDLFYERITPMEMMQRINKTNEHIIEEHLKNNIKSQSEIMIASGISRCAMTVGTVIESSKKWRSISSTRLKSITREISESIASELPMRVSKNMSIVGVLGVGNIITLKVILNYPQSQLESIISSTDYSESDIMQLMKKHAITSICKKPSHTRGFVNIGGEIRQIYNYIDGKIATEIVVKKCSD